jgi:hypothetical protein
MKSLEAPDRLLNQLREIPPSECTPEQSAQLYELSALAGF